MKKIITTILSLAIALGTLLSLTSCGDERIDPGKYKSESGEVIEVTYDKILMTEEAVLSEGTFVLICDYFIEDGKITITVESVEALGEGEALMDELEATRAYYKDGRPKTFEFEKTDSGFKLSGVEFTKQ